MLHRLFSYAPHTHTHTHCEYFIVFSEVKETRVQPETIRVTESSGRVSGTKGKRKKVTSGREDEVGQRVMRKKAERAKKIKE